MRLRTISLLIAGLLVLISACANQPTPEPTAVPSTTPQTSGDTYIKPTEETPQIPMTTPILTTPPTSSTSDPLILQVGGSSKYKSIQQAINSATSGATIQVVQGTYKENITLTASKTLTLQGGWDSEFAYRSEDSSLTVIDGRAENRVINIEAASGVTIEVVIDGFTIQNGKADFGAGIWAASVGTNARLVLTLDNINVTKNEANEQGSGISAGAQALNSSTTLRIINSTVVANNSNRHGAGVAIRSFGGSVEANLENNTVTQNTANNFGAGILIMSNNGGSASINLAKNIITGNVVTRLLDRNDGGNDGGGIAIYSTGSSTQLEVSINNNVIVSNEAGFGGGIYGHALDSANATITLANNIISQNTARLSGAGIFSLSGSTNSSEKPGGNIIWELTNNTIAGNISKRDSPGIGSNTAEGGATTISSCNDIIWGNVPRESTQVQLANVGGNAKTVTFGASYSNITSLSAFDGANTKMEHVIEKDPLFTDMANKIFYLQGGSPCIDSGDPSSIYNDGKRPPGKGTERNDIGAYGGPKNYIFPN
ncbi:DUF1565 domain-containing protein [Chloroflexota bacterium]